MFAKTECPNLPRPRPPFLGQDPVYDGDGDAVVAVSDWCANTPIDPTGENPINDFGCALSQMDEDNDCVSSLYDQCPQSQWGNRSVDSRGCPGSSKLREVWRGSNKDGAYFALGDNPGDELGRIVAVSDSGTTIAVGAPNHSWQDVPRTGQVQIFSFEGAGWSSSTLGDPDYIDFGRTLAMSGDGNKIAVAQGASLDSDGNGVLPRVQVYERSGSSWVQLGADITLGYAVDASGGDFGAALAMGYDGRTLAVGAPGSDGGSGEGDQRGEVLVYTLSGNTWLQLGQGIEGHYPFERSGVSVALSPSTGGTVVAIGTEANRARAYCLQGDSWFPRGGGQSDVVGAVGDDGEDLGEDLGRTVALSGEGDTLLVTLAYEGGARTFRWSGGKGGGCAGSWYQAGPDIEGESGEFNDVRVALGDRGNYALVSSPSSNYNSGAGRVRLYRRTFTAEDWAFQCDPAMYFRVNVEDCPPIEGVMGWAQTQPSIEGVPLESVGRAIAFSGNGQWIVVGSPFYDGSTSETDNRGRVLVYRLDR